jgi:hypothetical protein
MKKIALWLMALTLVLALGACNANKAPVPEDEGEEIELELTIETHFGGELSGDTDQPLGVYAYLVWQIDQVDYQITEYSGSFDNPIFTQSGTIPRPEDDVLIIEREDEAGGRVEMSIPDDSNNLSYRIMVGDETTELLLSILTEEEALELQKA